MVSISQNKSIILSIALIFVLIIIGTIGYFYLEKQDLLEGLYFTIVTITSVGYGDIHPTTTESKIFYMILMLIGVVSLFYLGATIIGTVIEGRLVEFLRRRLLENIKKMKNHVIICGYGDVGSLVAKGLDKKEVVIVEKDESRYIELTERGFMGVHGDSTDSEILESAMIKKARALIIALNKDPDAIYTILTAKELNPEIEIYVRANERGSLKKMKMAGANYVICLPAVGSRELLDALRKKRQDMCE